MRRTLTAALAALATIALLHASPAGAQPPPQCYFGTPYFTSKLGPYDASVKVKAHCGNGMLGCRSCIVVRYWFWDTNLQKWNVYGQSPVQVGERDELCGGDEQYTFSAPYALFAPGHLYCIEMEFWVWSTSAQAYRYVASGNTYFNN